MFAIWFVDPSICNKLYQTWAPSQRVDSLINLLILLRVLWVLSVGVILVQGVARVVRVIRGCWWWRGILLIEGMSGVMGRVHRVGAGEVVVMVIILLDNWCSCCCCSCGGGGCSLRCRSSCVRSCQFTPADKNMIKHLTYHHQCLYCLLVVPDRTYSEMGLVRIDALS